MGLDIDFVRSNFPAFEQSKLEGLAFFENAGGSYTCRQVIDRLYRFYTQRKVQPYGPYEPAQLGGAEMDDCLLYTSPSPRDQRGSRMPSSA